MQALPLGVYLFLAHLAAGGLLVTLIADLRRSVTRGFVLLNGVFLLLFGAAGLALRSALPAERMLPYVPAGTWLDWERPAWAAFLVAATAYLLGRTLGYRWLELSAGGAAAAAGLAALAVSALAYRPAEAPPVLLLLSFGAGALASGAVWSSMLLGHYYLVSPRLPARPLLVINAALAATLSLQAGLIVGYALFNLLRPTVGVDGAPLGLAALMGQFGQLFWLRSLAGVGLPLALAVMVWRTARTRSMMSATGLLYVALALVWSGELMAKALFFLTRVPI